MEKQHNRVRSSLQASECLTDRKDRVLLHGGSSVSIQPTPSIGTAGKRTGEFSPGLGQQVSRTGKRLIFLYFFIRFSGSKLCTKRGQREATEYGYYPAFSNIALPSLCCFTQTAHFLCSVLDTLDMCTKRHKKLSLC